MDKPSSQFRPWVMVLGYAFNPISAIDPMRGFAPWAMI